MDEKPDENPYGAPQAEPSIGRRQTPLSVRYYRLVVLVVLIGLGALVLSGLLVLFDRR